MVLAGQGVGCTGRSDSILMITTPYRNLALYLKECNCRRATGRREREGVKVKVKRLDEGLVRGKVEVWFV